MVRNCKVIQLFLRLKLRLTMTQTIANIVVIVWLSFPEAKQFLATTRDVSSSRASFCLPSVCKPDHPSGPELNSIRNPMAQWRRPKRLHLVSSERTSARWLHAEQRCTPHRSNRPDLKRMRVFLGSNWRTTLSTASLRLVSLGRGQDPAGIPPFEARKVSLHKRCSMACNNRLVPRFWQ